MLAGSGDEQLSNSLRVFLCLWRQDAWASAYRAAVQEVTPKVESKLNQLREDAYRAAEVEVPASFAADV